MGKPFSEEAGVQDADKLLADAGRKELHVLSPRDMVVTIIARAIRSGAKTNRNGNDRYIEGRVSAFVVSAADLVHMAYGTDHEAARRRLRLLVQDVRAGWSREDRLDAAKVGAEAHVLLGQLLELPQAD